VIVLGNLLYGIGTILDFLLTFVLIIIIAEVIVSWVNADPYNWIVKVIHSTTEPILSPLRNKLPLSFGGLDFTPVVAILFIYFLKAFLVNTIYHYAVDINPLLLSPRGF